MFHNTITFKRSDNEHLHKATQITLLQDLLDFLRLQLLRKQVLICSIQGLGFVLHCYHVCWRIGAKSKTNNNQNLRQDNWLCPLLVNLQGKKAYKSFISMDMASKNYVNFVMDEPTLKCSSHAFTLQIVSFITVVDRTMHENDEPRCFFPINPCQFFF